MKGVLRVGRGDDDESYFDQAAWDDATRRVGEAYANEGYIYANVRPVVERRKVGADSVPTVNLRWEIDEKTPAIVNRVEILGNDITAESCIRNQIFVVPGDVFRRDALLRSYQEHRQPRLLRDAAAARRTRSRRTSRATSTSSST